MNKVVLVTGSSKGIGRAIIKEFSKNGYDVVINYNTSYLEAKTLEEEIKIYNVKVLLIKCDVGVESEVKEMFDKVIKEMGRIDVVINNAGIAIDTMFIDKSIDNFKKILDTNLIGTFLVSKYFGSYMYDKKEGVILNISSTNGIDTCYPESIDYDASKAGVISLTHNLAKEFSPYIRVNALALGWVDTDMNKDMDISFKEKELNKICLHRFANPFEIAKVAYFVCNDGTYINSSIIRVDGGIYDR